MFIQPCFIRKNTEDLRQTLNDLGYKHIQSIIKNREEIIFVNMGYFSNNFPYNAMLIDSSIDCGTNSELFLAIAALRADSDKFQWFTDGENWVFCDSKKFGSYWAKNDVTVNLDKVHKATVQELIEYFNTNSHK